MIEGLLGHMQPRETRAWVCLTMSLFTAFLWKRMKEEDFPVTSETKAPEMDESKDLKAALSAAGGGRGAAKA